MAAHIAPEAARGGPIGALNDGDQLTIDVESRRVDVALSEQELADRLALYAPQPLQDHLEVAIAKYAKLVGSAAEGAVVR